MMFHVSTGFPHGFDHLVQRHFMGAFTLQGQALCIDCFDGSHGITFNTRNLDQPTDRIAGQAQVVFHTDFSCIFDLAHGSAKSSCQAARSHRTCNTNFTLATDLCPGYRGIEHI